MGFIIILDPDTRVAEGDDEGDDEGAVDGLAPVLSSVARGGRKYKYVPNLSTWQSGVLYAGPNAAPDNNDAVKKRKIQEQIFDHNINVACWVDVGIYLKNGNYVGTIWSRGGQAACPELAVLSLSGRMGSEKIRVRRLERATEAEEAVAGSEIADLVAKAIGNANQWTGSPPQAAWLLALRL